jgi:hypothetical protein
MIRYHLKHTSESYEMIIFKMLDLVFPFLCLNFKWCSLQNSFSHFSPYRTRCLRYFQQKLLFLKLAHPNKLPPLIWNYRTFIRVLKLYERRITLNSLYLIQLVFTYLMCRGSMKPYAEINRHLQYINKIKMKLVKNWFKKNCWKQINIR